MNCVALAHPTDPPPCFEAPTGGRSAISLKSRFNLISERDTSRHHQAIDLASPPLTVPRHVPHG